jgi:predicted AlkP superfamily phosphohydrolase/phosphomutase
MNRPRRVAVIGLDSAIPTLMQRHIDEGVLPAIKKIMDQGVWADNCLVPFPTITPPNWATIGTGAHVGTHQVVDFWVAAPGHTPDNDTSVQAFSSRRVKAEFIWDAMDKAGKKCIVLNYPGSWPSNMKNGLMVAGSGITPGEYREGKPNFQTVYALCGGMFITNGIYPQSIRSTFVAAAGWRNLEELSQDALEMEAVMTFPDAMSPVAPATWYVLARQSGDKGYDTITLSPSKDLKQAFCTVKTGEWSPKVFAKITMADGSQQEVFFRFKVTQLSQDAEEFGLYIPALVNLTPISSPPELAAKVAIGDGMPVPGVGLVELMVGKIDTETFGECCELYTQWVQDAALTLFKEMPDWDGFFMHCHPPDYAYHMLIDQMDPNANRDDEAKRATAWVIHRRMYQAQDRMIAAIMQAAGPETLIVLVSDHGATADSISFDVATALIGAGLAQAKPARKYKDTMDEAVAGFLGTVPDPSTSKAMPVGVYSIYINLKGRYPEGIVEPEDYETVQQQIIDTLYTYVHPKTGTRPVALALAKQDARLLGLYGQEVADVIYAIYPWFGSQHGPLLPTAKWGIGDLRGLWAMYGPGIRQGVRLQRTVHLEDLVPTICYAADLPVPKDVDGAVVFQVFEDPAFKEKEMAELTDALAKAEEALSGQPAGA